MQFKLNFPLKTYNRLEFELKTKFLYKYVLNFDKIYSTNNIIDYKKYII